jgi:hypothetical protein
MPFVSTFGGGSIRHLGGFVTSFLGISLNYQGGSGGATSVVQRFGTFATMPTPTQSGYNFLGWYDAASGGNKIADAGATYLVLQPKTLYAQWITANYTVTYNDNGGNGSPASATISPGSATTLPSPTRLNGTPSYALTGWYTAASGGTLVGAGGASYTPTANVTLYAQWIVTYSIYFMNQDSTTLLSVIPYAISGSTVTLPSPTDSPNTLIGWYYTATGNNPATGASTFVGAGGSGYTVTQSIVLYARWQPPLSVNYVLVGGGGAGGNSYSYFYAGGGGGGGGVVVNTASISRGSSVSVLIGGAGGNSTFGSFATAYAGGNGGTSSGAGDGASGGGAAGLGSSFPGGNYISGQGHVGGFGNFGSPYSGGGGGGGAGTAGGNGSYFKGGFGGGGGAGYTEILTSNGWYLGGGGGGAAEVNTGYAGVAVTGPPPNYIISGGNGSITGNGGNAPIFTGGGGGGAAASQAATFDGGNGSGGVLILSWTTGDYTGTPTFGNGYGINNGVTMGTNGSNTWVMIYFSMSVTF